MEVKPILNPVDDYKLEKASVAFRFDRHSFSFNYIHEIDYNFITSALMQISNNGHVNVNDILPHFNKLSTMEKARAGKGTQFKNTENYEIFLRYSGWEFDKIKHIVMNSTVDLNKPLSLTLHFAKLEKYDVDGLAKAFIDAFARYFLNNNDDNVVELHMSAHNISNQKDGYVDVFVENI